MKDNLNYEVHLNEKIYFNVKLIMGIILYAIIITGVILLFAFDLQDALTNYILLITYIVIFLVYLFFRTGYIIGHLKGNAIKITDKQFPDIYRIVNEQSQSLGLKSVPDVYILQSGGILNAFTTNFAGSNYVVLFSDIVHTANIQDSKILEFIIGHELGHIKRKHVIKTLFLFPSLLIPFLGRAYSRACEYTCDNIGHALCPEGARNGILLLAAGRNLLKHVNTSEFTAQNVTETGFWRWFAEIFSTHPDLSKRLVKFKEVNLKSKVIEQPVTKDETSDDYSKYMPR